MTITPVKRGSEWRMGEYNTDAYIHKIDVSILGTITSSKVPPWYPTRRIESTSHHCFLLEQIRWEHNYLFGTIKYLNNEYGRHARFIVENGLGYLEVERDLEWAVIRSGVEKSEQRFTIHGFHVVMDDKKYYEFLMKEDVGVEM